MREAEAISTKYKEKARIGSNRGRLLVEFHSGSDCTFLFGPFVNG